MSHEFLSDGQVLEEYAKVLVYLRNPYKGGLGYIGLSELHKQFMGEIIKRQLLAEAIEISREQNTSTSIANREDPAQIAILAGVKL